MNLPAFVAFISWLAAPAPAAPQGAASPKETFALPLPAASAVALDRDIVYTRSGERQVKADLYRPARRRSGERLPVILFVNTLAQRSAREQVMWTGWARAATARGFAAILPDAADDFATGLDALLDWIDAHAAERGLDPSRIAIHAASGNVSGAFPVISDPSRVRLRAAVLYYGVAGAGDFRMDLPTLVVRAGLDRPGLNEDLDAWVAAGIRANAPVTLINHPGGPHAFEVLDGGAVTRGVIERTFAFLAAALAPEAQKDLRTAIPAAQAAGAMQTGNFERAARLYGELVRTRPGDARLGLSYGEALLAAGRAHEARTQFETLKGAGLGPRDLALPAARASLADGDPAGAVAWLQTIPKRFIPASMRTDPDFAPLAEREDFQALFR